MTTAYQRYDAQALYDRAELTALMNQIYDFEIPERKQRIHIPAIVNEGGAGAEFLAFSDENYVGRAKLGDPNADDWPLVRVARNRRPVPVRSLKARYEFSFQDLRAAAQANYDLPDKDAKAAKDAVMAQEEEIAYLGDREAGIYGLLNYPYFPTITSDIRINFGTVATPDTILARLNYWASRPMIYSRAAGLDSGMVDSVLFPMQTYNYLSTTFRGTASDSTLLELFRKGNPNITFVDWSPYCSGAGTGGTDVIVFYKRDPRYLGLYIPVEFEQLIDKQTETETVVKCHERIAGVNSEYPLRHVIVENI